MSFSRLSTGESATQKGQIPAFAGMTGNSETNLNYTMKKYELLLVLPGTLDENESAKKLEEILNLVKESDKEAESHNLGKSRLAYPIKQIRYGYFYTIVFSVESEALKVLQDKLTLMRDLLRAMITVFNTSLTASQKIAYTTDSLGITTMAPNAAEPRVSEVAAPVVAAPKKEEKASLEDINKKLDEILEGDIIPGV